VTRNPNSHPVPYGRKIGSVLGVVPEASAHLGPALRVAGNTIESPLLLDDARPPKTPVLVVVYMGGHLLLEEPVPTQTFE
jgi:hypothetical protein